VQSKFVVIPKTGRFF